MAISPSGMDYFATRAEDVVVLDTEGRIVDSTRRPSSEWGLHAAFYRAKPEVDGERNTADLVLLQNYILGKSDLTEKQTEIADINKDGFINCFDIIILKRMLLNQ